MSKELTNYVDPAMYQSEPMETVAPRVYLLQCQPDPLGAVAAMSMIYEGKVVRNLADITTEQRKHYWEEMTKTKLTAPLESIDLHFLVEGVTRSFTHQMVRQRTAVYAQESLRFAVKENLAEEVTPPPSITEGSEIHQQLWLDTLDELEKAYSALIANGVPAEDARGLLPHNITTRLHYKTNLRNLIDHAGNRLCTQAQFEWRYVLTELVNAIRDYDPLQHHVTFMRDVKGQHQWQFQMIAESNWFRPACYQAGKCPFKADFDRGCTIRERADRGAFDEINDAEWLLDPTAARRK